MNLQTKAIEIQGQNSDAALIADIYFLMLQIQKKHGDKIEFEVKKNGDSLYFGNIELKKKKSDYVGFYIDGEEKAVYFHSYHRDDKQKAIDEVNEYSEAGHFD